MRTTIKRLLLLLLPLLGTTAMGAQKSDTFKTRSGRDVVITHIKHATMQISYDGKTIYVDPVIKLKPETDYSDYPKGDYIFVTHEHADHFDPIALSQLRHDATVVVANPSVSEKLHYGMTMKNGDHFTLSDDIEVWAVPAYNTTAGREQFHPKGRDNGYVLQIDGLRIYIAGDTEDIAEMATLENIDVAFLPCNQPYTMTVDQLVRAAKTFRPKVLFPYHYSQTPVSQVLMKLMGSGIEVRIRDYQ